MMSIIDMSGKTVLNANLIEGNNNINADFLDTGVYFLSFETSSNRKATQKIIKK